MQPSKTCTVCHRGLKDPASILRGMGPVCAGKQRLKDEKPDEDRLAEGQKLISALFDTIEENGAYFIPAEVSDIVLTRDDQGTAHASVPHRVVYHSPTGFEWGYGGSGPADLALNILASCVPLRQAYDLHQQFKWKFIAPMKREGGTIKGEDVLTFLRKNAPTKEEGGL